MAYNKVSVVAAFLFLAVAIASRLAEAQSPMFPKMDTKCATMMHDLREKCFVTASVIPTEDCCNDLKSETKTQVPCLCDNNYIPNPTIANVTGLYSAVITTKCGVLDKLACDATSEARPRKIPTREEFKQLIAALQSGSTSWNYFPRRRIFTSGHRMFNQHLLEDYPPLTDQMTSYKSYRA